MCECVRERGRNGGGWGGLQSPVRDAVSVHVMLVVFTDGVVSFYFLLLSQPDTQRLDLIGFEEPSCLVPSFSLPEIKKKKK